ncbi:MAG: hypothetical protein WBD53_09980 [Xanthobacteraceae bacterium]
MTKIVVAKLARKRPGGRRSRLATRHIRGPNGKRLPLFAVDSKDNNFDDDLTRAFTLNVERARQANTAMFGSPEGLPKKAVRKRK